MLGRKLFYTNRCQVKSKDDEGHLSMMFKNVISVDDGSTELSSSHLVRLEIRFPSMLYLELFKITE